MDPRKQTLPVLSAARSSGNYKWALVLMLWIVSFFNYADRNAITAVVPKLQGEFGFTKAQVGLLTTSFLWVYAAAAPAMGFLGDRFRRKTIILGGLVFWSLVTFVTPLAGSLGMFIALRALTGLGEAAYYPAGTAMISDCHDSRTRTRALALHQTAVNTGGILGPALAGFLADHYNWRYAFYFYGLSGIAVAGALWKYMREPEKGMAEHAPPAARVPLLSLFQTRSFLLISLVFCGANFASQALMSWMPTHLAEQYGLSLTEAGLWGTLPFLLPSLLGLLFSGWLADVLVKRTIMARVYLMAASLFLGAPFIFITGQVSPTDPIVHLPLGIVVAHLEPKQVVFLGMIVAGVMHGVFSSCIYAAMHDFIAPATRSTAAGVMTCFGFVGGGLSPYLIGVYAAEWGLGKAMALTCILNILVGGLLLAFRGTIRRDIENLAISLRHKPELAARGV